MLTQILHAKEESYDVGISILQTPGEQQTMTTNLPQILSHQGSSASLSFHPYLYLPHSPNTPDGRHKPAHLTHTARHDTYRSLTSLYQR